jgi:hypothetical protein
MCSVGLWVLITGVQMKIYVITQETYRVATAPSKRKVNAILVFLHRLKFFNDVLSG